MRGPVATQAIIDMANWIPSIPTTLAVKRNRFRFPSEFELQGLYRKSAQILLSYNKINNWRGSSVIPGPGGGGGVTIMYGLYIQ